MTPSENCRGSLEQVAKASAAHIEYCTVQRCESSRRVTCRYPYVAGIDSSTLPISSKWINQSRNGKK